MGKTGAHKAHKKVAHSLVALSSAAVLAVYSAGYQRTKAAADRFERLAASRRHAVPVRDTARPASTPATSASTISPAAPPVPAGPGPSASATETARGVPTLQPATPAGPASGSLSAAPSSTAPGATAESTPALGSAAAAAPAPAVPAVTEPQQAANAAPTEIAPITPPERGRFKDGTYQGRGSCIHGDIQAEVVVKNGRIVAATISSCETRYSCDWLDPILPQVAARQSAFVDYVSGATDSTDAFSAAVTDALLKAQ